MSSRKRHLEETLEEPEIKNGVSPKNNDIFGQVQEFRTLLLSEEPVEKKKFKQFRRVLSDIKDNEESQRKVLKLIDTKFLTGLFCKYSAKNSKTDLVIYKILRSLERNLHVNLRVLAPIVWGEKAESNYKQLVQFGQNLHQRMKADQVLEFFDSKQLWWTLLKMDDEKLMEKSETANFYDPRFVASVLFSITAPGSDLTLRKFVTSNALAFAFALTSTKDEDLRAYGYGILQRYLDLLKELTTEEFSERVWFKYVIRTFKNSVTETNQRIPHVVAHFFARVSKLMLHPEDPVFSPIMAFFQLKPTVMFDQVPEFYKLFLSSSTENFRAERHWVLKLMLEALIEPNDFQILETSYCIPLCLLLFSSPISEMESRKLILQLFKACLQHSSIAMSLFNLHSIHSWFSLTLQ
uniref:Nucleolar pre-ribosomal-associated protein 1 C-terminal domain-containing protein n=1 Tax=Acrobeloides nanus TaxID=290746 RepID=A0A914EF27_9BILA